MLIESFHSGPRGHRIYCSLHRPATRLVRSIGIVLCNPLGHEYYRAHRSYVKLAMQLSQLGFPVMRFDYTGCGDSEGERVHERLDAWLKDVSRVVDLLRQSESLAAVALGGLRFGAMISLLAAKRIDGVRALMLWDPAVEGARYVAELEQLHHRMLHDLERFPRIRNSDECSDGELVGTEYAPIFLRELAAISPASLFDQRNRNMEIVLATSSNATDEAMLDGNAVAGHVHSTRTSRDYGWQDIHRIGETIMDPDAIRHFTTSMSAIAA